ncbi:MAG: hypothetical protein M3Y46_03095, partial [Actinomycetota bacterium]|nr:hypothetical protein [Actinomycetota bacterium]
TGVVALLGGFNEVPVAKLPVIEVGQTHVGNEVSLRVDDIHLSSTAPVTDYDAPEGSRYLVIEATAENVTTSPNIFLRNALRVIVEGAVSGNDGPYSVVDLRTGSGVPFLQAGLPMRVAFLWEVDEAGVEPGDDIVVGIFERYDFVDDPRFDDSKTAPVPVVRILDTIGGAR